MRQLPREVDPLVYNMTAEDPGDVSYASVGGLGEQIRELREVVTPWLYSLQNLMLSTHECRLVFISYRPAEENVPTRLVLYISVSFTFLSTYN